MTGVPSRTGLRRRGQENRAALVEAAAQLFSTQGYKATSLADIAAAAGIPVGNVYHYFRAKAAIAEAVAEMFHEETGAMLDAVRQQTEDPRLRLKALVERLKQTQAMRVRHGCPIAGAAREFRSEAATASERAADSFTMLIGFVAAEYGRTGLRPSLALGAARSFVAEWQGGIALAHALQEPHVLAETFVRLERMVARPPG